jgi:YggT family protein
VLPLMLLDIIGYLIWIIQCLVIVLFVMSLLISFNVVNTHNEFVASVWKAVNILLDPLLNPIRRIMPNTGAIDFSPMVLVIILEILGKIVIPRLAMAVM